MDGGSTDGTVEYLKSLPASIRWVSEPDAGQADAMNKGLRLATGDILTWLNSDDVLISETAVERVVKTFADSPDVGIVYGDYVVIDEQTRPLYTRHEIEFDETVMRYGSNFIVPAAFWTRPTLDAIGYFDASLRYVMDFDYWLRAIEQGVAFKLCRGPVFGHRHQLDAKTVSQHAKMRAEARQLQRRYNRWNSDATLAALRPVAVARWQLRKLAERRRIDNLASSYLSHRAPKLWKRAAKGGR